MNMTRKENRTGRVSARGVRVDESTFAIITFFLTQFFALGLPASFGIMATKLIETYDFDRTSIAIVSACMDTTAFVFAFVVGGLCRLLGYRVPIILGGIITSSGFVITAFSSLNPTVVTLFLGFVQGVGISLLYYVPWIAANTYYRKKRQLANSLIISGCAVGSFSLPPLAHWLLNLYGLRGTCLILGGCALNGVVLGAMVPPLITEELDPYNNVEDTPCKTEADKKPSTYSNINSHVSAFVAIDLLTNWKFALFVIVCALWEPTLYNLMYAFLPDFIIHVGYPPSKSWLPVTMIGIFSAVSRLAVGVRNKSMGVLTVLFNAMAFTTTLSVAALPVPLVFSNYWMICAFAALHGISRGITYSTKGPVLAGIVAENDIGRGIGLTETMAGIMILTRPLLGLLYDVTGEYTWTFLTPGIMTLAAACIFIPVSCSFRHVEKITADES